MKTLDIVLSAIAILCVLLILFLVQAVSNPHVFSYLVTFNLVAEGNDGIKNILILIFSLGFISSILLLFLFSRIIIRLLTQK